MKKHPSAEPINISEQTKAEAMNIAKATQKPGQNKEQTKLIAQGIEKGIALYKKQQKEKQRQADREKKRRLKEKQNQVTQQTETDETQPEPTSSTNRIKSLTPWLIAILGWSAFAVQWFTQHNG